MKTDSNKKMKIDEMSFDLLDWKNGSLTGNGLKQAVDMFKAQDAATLTAVIYDRKTRKMFNIVDVHLGNAKSGHGLEIDIDTSKEVLTESEKDIDDNNVNEADDCDPLSHALDPVGVKASTANSKAQDEVQMSTTDGDTYAGIDAAIDRDIDAAMEEIYR